MTEEQILDYAINPEKIVDPRVCNSVTAYLNGHITDLMNAEWEKRLVSSQKKVQLLNDPKKTNAQAKAEWEISEEYKDWQTTQNKLRQYRAYRNDLKDRFQVLIGNKRF